MSKSIKIPSERNPFVVIINGKRYAYIAGATVTVPDEVAAEIERYAAAMAAPDPVYPTPGYVLTAGENGSMTFAPVPDQPAATEDKAGSVKMAENIADSEADTVETLKGDFNDLLAALKAAGIMAPDEEAEGE